MSTLRYIEITSTHRNRNKYPYPSQFSVDLSFSGQTNRFDTARDPIYSNVTLYPSTPSYYNNPWAFGPIVNGSIDPLTVGILPLPKDNIDSSSLLGNSIAINGEYRKITSIEPYTIVLNTTIDAVEPIFLDSIPLDSTFVVTNDELLSGWTVYFPSSGLTRIITYYREFDKRIFLNIPTPVLLAATSDVVLSREGYIVHIDSPLTVPLTSAFTPYRITSGHTSPETTGILVGGSDSTFITAGLGPYQAGNLISITSNPIVLSGAFVNAGFISNGTEQIQGTFETLPNTIIKQGMQIVVTSGVFSQSIHIITSWDETTFTGTITPGWTSLILGVTSPVAGDTFDIVALATPMYRRIVSYDATTFTGTVFPRFSYTLQNGTVVKYNVGLGDTFEILKFDRDNYQALNGFDIGNQILCTDIELISLIIPNKLSYGKRISQYPYFYIEFKSQTQGTSAFDFTSNNPAVTRSVMFRAPHTYNYNLETANFITLDGHMMTQRLKFTQNDSFFFSVTLPDGRLLIFDEPDTSSPLPPNPDMQITACFKVCFKSWV